jgi:hypothetical protein
VSPKQKPQGDFEQRLLARLKTVVAERGAAASAAAEAAEAQAATPSWRRRAPRLAVGAGIALVAVAIALIVSAGGDNTSKAFAVEPQDGGGVTIKIYSLEDASGLEQALEDAGVQAQVTWLPTGMTCREPHYTPSIVHLPGGGSLGGFTMGGPGAGGMTFGVGSTKRWRERSSEHMRRVMRGEIPANQHDESIPNQNLDPQAFRPGQSVVLFGAPAPYDGNPEGGSIAMMGIAEGPVEPCKPVPALPSGSPFGLSAGGGPGYTPRGDEGLSQAAVAAVLRGAASAAEMSETQIEAAPTPGQYLYTKTKVAQLQGWLPKGSGTRPAGPKAHPRYFTANLLGPEGDALPALVPTLKEVWMAPAGATRERETLGRIDFLSAADQQLWKEAGSPPPFSYDPNEHEVDRDSSGRAVKEFDSKAFRGRREFTYMSKLSQLPTEPEALRLAIENRRGGSSPVDPSPADSPRGGATVERLLEILSEPITSSALRAAVFNALAEIPGIGLERDVADVAGRRGDAISWVSERGFGRRYIFDPHTSKILAQAEMIFGPSSTGEYGAPAGTPYRETAYLQAGIVDSAHERLK